MKNCKKCGAEIAKSAKVCPKCGARFGLPGFVKVLIILAIIFVCLFGCVAACTKGAVDAVDEAFTETENDNKDVNGKTEFKLNETFENKYVKLTMTDVNLDFKNYSKYADVKSGYKVISATFNIENIGESDDLFDNVDFDCYADEEAMDSFYSVDDATFTKTISAGKKASGTVYFLVPKDAKKITIEYDASWLDNVNIVYIVK